MPENSKYDVLLVYPKGYSVAHSNMLPLGLASIAAVLESNGFTVKIVDLNFYGGRFESDLTVWSPKIVGIGGTTPSRKQSFQVANCVKDILPCTIVVYGGNHATFAARDTLENITSIDYVLKGEAEYSFLSLCNKILRNEANEAKSIAGLCYRENGHIVENRSRRINSLDDLPNPARHLFDHDYIFKLNHFNVDTEVIMTSRGCSANCSFCSASRMFPGGIKSRSMESVKAEIDTILSVKRIKGLKLFDSTFTADREHVLEFCKMIKPYNMLWECEIRADTVDRSLLEIMKESGCCFIDMGIETTNEKLLKKLNKHITVGQAENVLRWCRELGIKTKVFFIFGHPDQTIGDCLNDIRWLRNHRDEIDYFANTLGMKLYPGTSLEKQAREGGFIPADFSWANHKPKWRNLLLLEVGDTLIIENRRISVFKLMYVGLLLNLYRINFDPSQFSRTVKKIFLNHIDFIAGKIFRRP